MAGAQILTQLISSQSSQLKKWNYDTYDSTLQCRSNKHITVAFSTCYLFSQLLAGRFISQVNVAEPIFATSLNSLTNTLAVLRALSACWSQHAHTPMAEHLRERESCGAGCHIPTASWKIPIYSNTSLLPLERERGTFQQRRMPWKLLKKCAGHI